MISVAGPLRTRIHSAIHPECGWPEQLRRIRRKLAWTTAGFVVVSVPVLVLAIVGLPHVFRDPVSLRIEAAAPPGGPAVTSPDFAAVLALGTGAEALGGHQVELLLDGEGTFPRLWADLRSARRSITVQMYYAAPGAVTDSVVRILSERARAGVEVLFLYDAFGAQDLTDGDLGRIRAAGARTAELRPLRWYTLDRGNHRSHVRGIVIDGAVAYTGGFGFDDKWLGGGRRAGEWRETNVRFTGPAVARVQESFVAKWAEATGTLLADERLLPRIEGSAVPGSTAAVLLSPPVEGSTAAQRLLVQAIESARERLYITNAYFVPHSGLVPLLAEAARRGVDVRILTNGPRSDVRTTWLAGRSHYEPLLETGVRIYEYQPTTLHAKTFVVDGAWSAVTTINLDNRSLAYNDEVAFLSLDPAFGARMDTVFLADLAYAEEIRLEIFRRRRWSQRLLEYGAGLLSRLL